MPTTIRPELSVKNEYWINKHRYYELKHFCRQYHLCKKEYNDYLNSGISTSSLERVDINASPSDPTARQALLMALYSSYIDMIQNAAKQTDEHLHPYILKAVTEGLSYNYLKTKLNMPCSRDHYYMLYRRFFFLLSMARR